MSLTKPALTAVSGGTKIGAFKIGAGRTERAGRGVGRSHWATTRPGSRPRRPIRGPMRLRGGKGAGWGALGGALGGFQSRVGELSGLPAPTNPIAAVFRPNAAQFAERCHMRSGLCRTSRRTGWYGWGLAATCTEMALIFSCSIVPSRGRLQRSFP